MRKIRKCFTISTLILTSMLRCANECAIYFFYCRQLDNRLTKVAPVRATISAIPVKEPGDVDETSLRRTMLKNISAGKASPYTKVELKVFNEFQVKVTTNSQHLN